MSPIAASTLAATTALTPPMVKPLNIWIVERPLGKLAIYYRELAGQSLQFVVIVFARYASDQEGAATQDASFHWYCRHAQSP
jgi:hypothetical protein